MMIRRGSGKIDSYTQSTGKVFDVRLGKNSKKVVSAELEEEVIDIKSRLPKLDIEDETNKTQ